mgnify:CR=1 FL=1|tara:strand:+ start:4727 stop:5404 length:678 start_codon:yes stop_codon:yes gene_type:complete
MIENLEKENSSSTIINEKEDTITEDVPKEESKLWFNDPNILVKELDIWPMEDMSSVKKYNAITRLVLILTIIGFIATKSIQIILIGIICLGIIVYVNINNKEKDVKVNINENFVNNDLYELIKPNLDLGSKTNPFGNVMMESDSSKKITAPAYNINVKAEIKKNVFETIKETNKNNSDIDKIIKNDVDNKNFESSLHNYYSTANSQQPNDQQGFIDFCYGDLAKK